MFFSVVTKNLVAHYDFDLNEWKHFCRQFLFSVGYLFFPLFFSSVCIFVFEAIRWLEITDRSINIFFVEMQLKKENSESVCWAPKF